ncbi:MAG: hypothetical protein JXA67_17405 [Micromonosporaceae bacterium]|nr:hypothetical protein [Micromonosporaceae bacterium]
MAVVRLPKQAPLAAARDRGRGARPAPVAVVLGVGGATPEAILPDLISELPDGPDPLVTGRELLADAASIGQTWVVVRYGNRPRALAYVPGQRRPRVIETGVYDVKTISGRPPRHIAIEHPSPELETLTLACAPPIRAGDQAAADLLMDALRSAFALVIVTTGDPFQEGDVAVLAQVAERVEHLAFVVTPAEAAVGPGQRAVVAARGEKLASAPWYDRAAGRDLMRRLAGWAAAASAAEAAAASGAAGPVGAPEVPADDERWRAVLSAELNPRQGLTATAISERCAAIRTRCSGTFSAGQGCADLPASLDRELHALSVRVTRRIDRDAERATGEVCGALIGSPPDQAVLARARQAVRRAIESSEDAAPARALMVTTTAGIAAVLGHPAVEALAAVGEEPRRIMTTPIGVAVTSSCYHLWRRRDPQGVSQCHAWLTQALRGVEAAVIAEADRRYDEVRSALEAFAADAVEHGFLLT